MPRDELETTDTVGMVIFLAAWAMLFAALLFAYAFVRSRAGSWPPGGGEGVGLWGPLLNAVALLLSVLALPRAGAAGSARRGRLAVAALFGAAFLAGQVWLWTQSGLSVTSEGVYGAVLLALGGLHALHVAVGVGALGVLAVRSAVSDGTLRLWALYWHFVGAVWAVMLVALFVL